MLNAAAAAARDRSSGCRQMCWQLKVAAALMSTQRWPRHRAQTCKGSLLCVAAIRRSRPMGGLAVGVGQQRRVETSRLAAVAALSA